MADVFTKAKRSEVMSRIRSHGNQATELALAVFFRRHKISGWRRQVNIVGRAALPRRRDVATGHRRPTFRVRPDFVFPKRKVAVFVDGCFWHGCPWHGTQPKGHAAFWRKKITGNQARDRRVNRALRAAHWRVLRIWEHTLRRATRKPPNEARLVRRIWAGLVGRGS